MACFRLGRPEDGWAVLKALLPQNHPTQVYRGEPHVLAADVSYAPGLEGRAGWSWYTGAAGWYWQAAVEELLGLQVRGGQAHPASQPALGLAGLFRGVAAARGDSSPLPSAAADGRLPAGRAGSGLGGIGSPGGRP